MVTPLAALSFGVAAGLALFATALALPRPVHPPARGPLLALLVALAVLVLRGALLRTDLWVSSPLELAISLSTFLAIPLLMVALTAAAQGHILSPRVRRSLAAVPLGTAVGLAMWMGWRGDGLPPTAWKAFVVGLYAVTLASALEMVRLRAGAPRPPWLDTVLGLFALHWLLSLASWTVGVFGLGGLELATMLEVGSLVSLLGFGAVAVVRALQSLPVFRPPVAAPYAGSGLDTDLCRQRADALRMHMLSQTPHLNPDLSAADLADALGLTSRELSQVLNVEIGQGFFEFVNAYRVDEAKRQLVSPDLADRTILEILYHSGFNSKSAFHRAFKANVGMTPSAYRLSQTHALDAQAA